MVCAKCLEHRRRLLAAARNADLRAVTRETLDAARTMGENAGRKLVRATTIRPSKHK